MNRIFLKRSLLMGIIILLAGCSRIIPVDPELQYIDPPERITKSNFENTVDLINSQDSDELKYFGDFTVHKLHGNMHAWTDQAIQLTKKELEQRGASVTEGAEKKIYLSFDGLGVDIGSFSYICNGILTVKTSSGYKNDYYVSNKTGGNVNRACGGAITLSVIDFINDKEIIDFLSSK